MNIAPLAGKLGIAAACVTLGMAASAALPAGAATHQAVRQPKVCRVLQHVRTDGRHSLRFYARQMDGNGAQLLILSGLCSTQRSLNRTPVSVLRYHDFSKPFPAGFTLYGPF